MPATKLAQEGFDRWQLWQHFELDEADHDFQALCDSVAELPADPYDATGGRRRRYGRGLLLPWNREFYWMPEPADDKVSGYYQGQHSPEFAGKVRALAALSNETQDNPLLRKIIMFDYEQTMWSEEDTCWPLFVGVHLLVLRVDADTPEAVASPNEFHQDGEPYTFVHLLYRRNVIGGTNIIAHTQCRGLQPADVPADKRLAEFVMLDALDGYGVADKLVSHYVAPVRRADSGDDVGERAVILIDWVPMRHQI